MAALIAHASEHGSTKEIAERIAARIASHRLQTECLPIDRVTDMSPYKYVIVGSAVHAMRWLPPVEKFIHDRQKILSTVPVWTFSVGYPAGMPRILFGKHPEEKEEVKLEKYVNKMVQFRKHTLFNGKFDKENAGSFFGWIFSLIGGHFGDSRDWDAIEKWADGVAEEIKEMEGAQGGNAMVNTVLQPPT
jgi:menaquinone-dependent protoporphyrinogen oxidase